MQVYFEVFGGDEIISNSFELTKVFNDAGAEVKSKLIVKGAVEVDIGRGSQFGGADPEEEVLDPNTEKVNNVVDAFHYQETSFTKADFQNWIKAYMKKLKEYLEANNKERVDGFMKGAKEMVGFILGRFNDFQFFLPESYSDNTIILAYYKADTDTAPTFLYFLDGLKAKTF